MGWAAAIVQQLLVLALWEGGRAVNDVVDKTGKQESIRKHFIKAAENRPDQFKKVQYNAPTSKGVQGFECIVSEKLKVHVGFIDGTMGGIYFQRIDKGSDGQWKAGELEEVHPDKVREELRERYDLQVKQKVAQDKAAVSA